MCLYRSYRQNKTCIFSIVLAVSVFCGGCARKQEPVREGMENYGDAYVDTLLGDASYLNPLLSSDSASGSVNSLLYNGLVKYDRDIKLVPELAESWAVSGDGLQITFRLRKDVKWHDGEPFTARDVEYTYRQLINPDVKTPYSSDYLLVKKFEVPDDYTVRVTYGEPFAPALESWGMGIIPEHIFANPPEGSDFNSHPANRNPVGTGPYRFVQWRTDEKVVLEANPDYYEGRPHLDRVIYRVIPDQSIQFLELRNESIDSMGLRPDQYKAYDSYFKKYDRFRYPSFSYTYLGFNLLNPVFADKRVRKAIAHSLDKTEIIDGVLLGMGKPATGPFVPQSWAHNGGIKDYEYSPEKARKLLAEAGWEDTDGNGILEKDGREFEFTLITNQGNKLRQLTAEIVQRHLQQIGIKMNIRIIEWSAFIHDFINKKNFEVVILGWSLGRDPDQYSIWHSEQTKEGQYNFVTYKNPEADSLIDRGRHTFDQRERERIYKKLHRVIFDDIPYIFLYYAESLPVIHKRIQGPEVAPLGLGWNFREWYVPRALRKY